MTKQITDQELHAAIDGAFDLWQSRYEGDLPEHTFSADFETKVAAIPETKPSHRRKPIRTVAAVAAIVATLTMTVGAELLPPVRTFRSGMVEIVSQLLPKSTDQTYTADTDHEGETRRPVLGWLPEDMTQTDRTDLPNTTRIVFENTDGDRLSIYTHRVTEGSANTVSIDTEDAKVSELILHNNPATMAVENDRTLIEFFIDNYNCSVISTIPTEQVLKVAENIELK